jgi:hypothetical protein
MSSLCTIRALWHTSLRSQPRVLDGIPRDLQDEQECDAEQAEIHRKGRGKRADKNIRTGPAT